jgi:hypothetical protein
LRSGVGKDPEGAGLFVRSSAEIFAGTFALGSRPESIDWSERGMVHPVRYQDSSASCVAHAACAAIEARMRIAGIDAPVLAPRSLHMCFMGLDYTQSASRWLLRETVRSRGVPLDDGTDAGLSDRQMCGSSDELTVVRPAGIFDLLDAEGVRREIAARGPVIGHMIAREDFFRHYIGTIDIYSADSQSPVIGEHAVCIVGYDDRDQCWIGVNSLGEDWGQRGFFRIGYSDEISRLFNGGLPAYAIDVR